MTGREKMIEHELAAALHYAQRLATSLYEQHWKQSSPRWQVLPDLIGVLTQIDNMTAGLTPRAHGECVPSKED